MACACPVVASTTGAAGEAVIDGVTGVLVPPHDAGATAAAIDRILGDAAVHVIQDSEHPDDWSREDCRFRRFVIERHISGDDGRAECFRRGRNALDRPPDLPRAVFF